LNKSGGNLEDAYINAKDLFTPLKI